MIFKCWIRTQWKWLVMSLDWILERLKHKRPWCKTRTTITTSSGHLNSSTIYEAWEGKKWDIKLKREVIEPRRPSNRVDGSANIPLRHPIFSLSLTPFYSSSFSLFISRCSSFPNLRLPAILNKLLPLVRSQSAISQPRTAITYVVHFEFKHHRNHEHVFSQESPTILTRYTEIRISRVMHFKDVRYQ